MLYQTRKHRFLNFVNLILFILASVSISCKGQTGSQDQIVQKDTASKIQIRSDINLPGGFSKQTVIRFDSAAIPQFMKQYPKFKAFEKRMQQFYTNRKYAYAWFDTHGLIEQAGNLYNKINNIQEEGWSGTLLYPEALHAMMDEDSAVYNIQKANPEIDLMLTAQYFFYAENIWTGMGADAMRKVNWDLPQKTLSYESLLDSLLTVPSSQFMKTEPVYRQYGLLKNYLKKYRQIAEQNSWEPIKLNKKSYRVGDSSSVIATIRKNLYLAGDLPADNKSQLFDSLMEKAVKNYQQRYGLQDDGVIGSSVIAEMNYPLEKKIEQIIVNMERCRWVPVALKRDYVVVNIPEYRFHAYENDTLIWSMSVVVGTSMNKTAIFNGMMNTIVFSPYWNIPPGILKNETLPAIKRDKKLSGKKPYGVEW